MADYGHDLRFGAFLTPSNAEPAQVVDLAVHAEQVGLDLVTFQDHPYQPGFHDTWTLLSYVGARTSAVHLAPNVINLPLRPPAVLARSAASLDLLTDGRLDLGLGAGAFWDGIVAMGGSRLSGAQGVRALAEAIEIIRGIWAVGERSPLRVPGEHHRVDGAKRGPAPAHDIPIWLGAYKPRMLALTGRVADGWLPSLGYLDLADLPAANARIDEAATSAGRDPAAVRRLINLSGRFQGSRGGPFQGPPAQWVAELVDLVLEHGMSTFILGGDDPRALEVLAQEVAPAVREQVDAERERRQAAGHLTTETGSGPTGPASGQHEETAAGGSVQLAAGAGAAVRESALGVTVTVAPERLREESLLDEETRPQAAPPEAVTYTEEGRAAGRHLVEVHDMLRAELTKVRDVVDQVRAGSLDAGRARSAINAMTMRQNQWTLGAYCASYCRVVTQHHSLEDAQIFPHLRSGEPTLEPVIDRLEAEHHVIHEVLENLDRSLVAVIRQDVEDLDELQDAVDALTDTLHSHFAYEEAQLVEPLARLGFYPGQLGGR
ncbi:LLM class flavin-dependent oxidoreductase [Actinotalea sp. C106]|uniref:LLM class flavin-dependent oxidoreductase n=1 Tax=Actinotalea sp. C106 TaxID=2908644 RepID=UPI0020277476|nr:LLM class flavin-dependent oxidoreductase [Actinotalea sp. C106]